MEYLCISLFIFSIIASFISPIIGMYAFFVLAYLRPQDLYFSLALAEPAKIILIVTTISSLFYVVLNKKKLVVAKQNFALLGILLCVFISRLNVDYAASWWYATEDFIVICLAYFLIINLLDTPKKLRNFYIFFILINLIVALRFYIAYKTGTATYRGDKPGDFSYGFLGNADDLGLAMVVAMAYCIIPIFYVRSTILKIVCAGSCGCFMLSVLQTGSRSSCMAILVLFLVSIMLHLKIKRLRQNKLLIGMLIVLMMFGVFVLRYRYVLKESFNSVQVESDPGRLGRLSTWAAAKQMIRDHPIIGVGRGNYVNYWRMHYPPGIYGYQVAHNIIYEVTSEIGFVGLFFFLVFSLIGFYEIRKLRKKYSNDLKKTDFLDMLFTVYIVGFIGFFANGLSITVAFYWHIYILVAIFVSAKNLLHKQSSYEKIKT